jgi:quercetin dioxygenase-like cupin family protein
MRNLEYPSRQHLKIFFKKDKLMGYFSIKDLESQELAEGVKIQVIPGERMTMVVFSLKNGTPIPEHSHPHEQMGVVMEGKMKMTIGQKEKIVEPGSAWHIPSNVVHGGECLEDETVVLEYFSPPREDFVKK